MRLGVFGGTFNPIHFGHLRAAEEVRQRLNLQEVRFVPSASPPLKSEDLAGIEHRFLMTSMAIATNEHFKISDVECRKPGKSFTIDTARTLKKTWPDAEIFFVLGVDAFLDLPRWKEPEALTELMNFAVIARPPHGFSELAGSPFVQVPARELQGLDRGESEAITLGLPGGRSALLLGTAMFDISSSAIRQRIRAGQSIKYLLPERVESFIMSNGLYKG